MLSAIDRNQRPQSIGIPVRNPRNPQRLVRTDAYQLSIGEIINMYRNEEIVINPNFQRLFRWEINQKAKFVESLPDYDRHLDVEEFIDESIRTLTSKGDNRVAGETFRRTFDSLNDAYGQNALRRFTSGAPTGRVILAAFESIAIGISKNIGNISSKTDPVHFVKERIRQLWDASEVNGFFTAGLRGTVRLQRTIPFGVGWFAQ